MPSLRGMGNGLPIPQDDKEFEIIVKDYCKKIYNNADLFGRNGQKQNGIDIFSVNEDDNTIIGIQCKFYSKINKKDIDSIINELEGFTQPLSKIIIATTAKRDSKIQEYTLELNVTREVKIEMLYWDTISDIIVTDEEMLKRHYPQSIQILYFNSKKNENTMEDMINEFNTFIQECYIIQYLNIDQVTQGVEIELVGHVDVFIIQVGLLLQRYILFQQEKKYIAIKKILRLMNEYAGFCGEILFPTRRRKIYNTRTIPYNKDKRIFKKTFRI